MHPTIDLTCCCKKDFDLNVIIILVPDFFTTALSKVLIGDFELQEEDLKVEKSLFPSNSLAAFFMRLKFKIDLMCHALLNSNDNGAIRLIITYLYSLFLALYLE